MRTLAATLTLAALLVSGCGRPPCVVTANTIASIDDSVKAGARAVAILCAAKQLKEADCAVARKAQDDYVVAALAALDLAQAACATDKDAAGKASAVARAAANNALAIFNTFVAKAAPPDPK